MLYKIPPDRLRFKLDEARDLSPGVQGGDWDIARRMTLSTTAKYRTMVERYEQGMRWEDTALFREIYAVRFARGETVRRCGTIEELAQQYYTRVDAMFQHLKKHGFLSRVDEQLVPPPVVYLGRDGEPIMSNNGNHRIAMAKVLKLPYVLATIRTRHSMFKGEPEFEPVMVHPVLHEGVDQIPAMTTPEERYVYYTLAKAQAPQGAVVELGTWLGAATAYMAAGIRDAGVTRPMFTYDRFVWQDIHEYKAGKSLEGKMVDEVRRNLGPLAKLVKIYEGEITHAIWSGGPIGLLVADGPKRVGEIAATLKIFGPHMAKGSMTAWQDFGYFPAYDQPVYFDFLERAKKVSFVRGVYPGTTAVFQVEGELDDNELKVSKQALASWGKDEIMKTWGRWSARMPEGMRPRFMCGAVMFLCDRGFVPEGTALFKSLVEEHKEAIVPKWEYFREKRTAYLKQYPSLFQVVDQAA